MEAKAETMLEQLAADKQMKQGKQNRHVTVGLSHLRRRKDALVEKVTDLQREIDKLEAAILALE